MIFDQPNVRERTSDQAEGLRQLRRPDAAVATTHTVLPWPRVVLISEFPGTDFGARFAFHLATSLGASENEPSQSLLVDLAPAASRLPHLLSDHIPCNRYPALWTELAAGHSLCTYDLNKRLPAVAAESHSVPHALDQLPRLYEQLMRQIIRQSDRWRWIVLLALDQVVPLDRACWQAADDIVLMCNQESTACHRQAAALRARISENDPQRSLWMLPTHSEKWLRFRRDLTLLNRWFEAGLAPKQLPRLTWPSAVAQSTFQGGTRADGQLARGAHKIAMHLRELAKCPDARCQNGGELVENSGSQKKIQLPAILKPINQITEEFRA